MRYPTVIHSSHSPDRRRLKSHAPPIERQRGVVAIALAVMAVAAAGAALGSFMLQRSQGTQVDVQGQRAVLQWADSAVRAFALNNQGLLPCPASSRNGQQDCASAGHKGWLPVSSLIQAGGDPPPQHALLNLRYMVNRNAVGAGIAGTARDMTQTQAVFVPTLIDGGPMDGYPSGISSSMDLCASLRNINEQAAAPGAATTPRWRIRPDAPLVPGATVPEARMLYGVAVSAPRATDAASGVNANFGVMQLESPNRASDHTYTDLVSVTRPGSYYDQLACGSTVASLDNMAMAQTWIGVAAGQRDGNIAAGKAFGDILLLGTMADAMYLVTSFGDLANGIYNIAENAVKLVAAILSFQFDRIPNYVKGMAIAPVGMAGSIIDTARISVALALDATTMAAYYKLASDAEARQVWLGGSDMVREAHQAGFVPVMPAGGTP
ncbi:hypothetical protein [Hydrogenophaga sp.]|uniref:hypothetical protein n=1 Tax=Hydrogenophaga sp. TaxID=1904254 RepID=UPI003F72D3F6